MIVYFLGECSLLLGMIFLLLPLFLTELSRPKDWLVGALFLILGLVLFLDNYRFKGSPTIAILAGAFLLGKIFAEAFQFRWNQLTDEEKFRIGTFSRWTQSFKELASSSGQLGVIFFDLIKSFFKKQNNHTNSKKWVRPESNRVNNKKTDGKSDIKDLSESNMEKPLLKSVSPSEEVGSSSTNNHS